MRALIPSAALALFAALSPAFAQVKGDVGAAAAAGAPGVSAAAASSVIQPLAGPLAALSPAPALAPAALSAAAPLPASALRPAVAASIGDAPRAAAPAPAAAPAVPAAAAPDAAGAPAAPRGEASALAGSLGKLGVDPELSRRLAEALGDSGDAEAAAALAAEPEIPAGRKVLLVVAGAARGAGAEKAGAARALIEEAAVRHGFTSAQVSALGLAENGASSSAAFESAARAAFPGEEWGVEWGRALASAANAAPPSGLARRGADADARAAKALAALGADPRFAASAAPDLADARRYVRSIAAGIALNERQTDGLLTQYFEERGIPPGSERAEAVRRALLPAKVAAEDAAAAGLSSGLKRRRAVLLRMAADRGMTPAAIEAVLERAGVLADLEGVDDETFERQADRSLDRAELRAAVAGYPRNVQGDFMRALADNMATPSGKSVEEVARAGVFAYVDFSGGRVVRATSGRDPDVGSVQALFYVTRSGRAWRLDGYRQNRRTGKSDAELARALKEWLISGGVPARDLR